MELFHIVLDSYLKLRNNSLALVCGRLAVMSNGLKKYRLSGVGLPNATGLLLQLLSIIDEYNHTHKKKIFLL